MISRRDPRHGAYLTKRRIPMCRSCGTMIVRGWATFHDGCRARRVTCGSCPPERARRALQRRAIAAVGALVYAGRIQPAWALSCVDCAAPASEYDHRDYGRPLDVEPVCHSCNIRRGPANENRLRAFFARTGREPA
jgi:hypothetical protein